MESASTSPFRPFAAVLFVAACFIALLLGALAYGWVIVWGTCGAAGLALLAFALRRVAADRADRAQEQWAQWRPVVVAAGRAGRHRVGQVAEVAADWMLSNPWLSAQLDHEMPHEQRIRTKHVLALP